MAPWPANRQQLHVCYKHYKSDRNEYVAEYDELWHTISVLILTPESLDVDFEGIRGGHAGPVLAAHARDLESCKGMKNKHIFACINDVKLSLTDI
jgi:hypothetical protein